MACVCVSVKREGLVWNGAVPGCCMDQNSQTAKVFGSPVGSSALILAVMDVGDNALSSIPVRNTVRTMPLSW